MISDQRYIHLISEAGTLLAQLYALGASYEDFERSKSLLEHASPLTIGGIIHDLQSQITDLERYNAAEGIDPNCFEEEDDHP